MRYFDSRDEAICLEHVMASGALPPAFPAIRVDGEPYWDGGIYSNTPIEARARRSCRARLGDLSRQRLAAGAGPSRNRSGR
jgi:predicted acylesterase/phospholipase RssA